MAVLMLFAYERQAPNGTEREILYDTATNGEEAQPLPHWLFPVKSTMEFLNMDAGDGRNQGLFYYILKVPLSEDEIDAILQDNAFKSPYSSWVQPS